MSSLRITRARKAGNGLLCKRIALGSDGWPVSDGSACRMVEGTATRVEITRVASGFADLITDLKSSEALILGNHGAEGDKIRLVKSNQANPAQGLYGRTKETFHFPPGEPAACLLDHDMKGMSDSVAQRMDAAGGFEGAVAPLLPDLETYARVIRASTSAGLYNKETGDRFPSSGGLHMYLFVLDGEDIPRFLRDLQARAWLKGLGWIMVAGRGARLVRSIVDVSVSGPERLTFEGPPQVVAPLAQDEAERMPIAHDGEMIDTRAACPPLTEAERQEFDRLVSAAKAAAKPAAEAAVEAAADKLVEKRGIDIEKARAVISSSIKGELLSWDSVHFDDDDLGVVQVADILADPKRFHGETLADPIEGRDYGRGKGKLYFNGGGSVVINSFAHGGGTYKLRHDRDSITIKVEEAGDDAPEVLARMLVFAHGINSADKDRLRTLAAKVSGVSKTAIRDLIKEHAARARHEELEHRAGARRAADDDGDEAPRTDAGDGSGSDLLSEYRAVVAKINKRYFVVDFGGVTTIATYVRDEGLDRDVLHFVRVQDFKLKYQSDKVLVGLTQAGNEIWKDVGTAWLESSMRRQYDGATFVFDGECPSNILNLWRGWGYPPKAGDWDTIAWHLRHIVCSENQRDFEYLIKLLARWVQNPGLVGEVAIVMRGEKGTGKGSVADVLKRWFRHHSVDITQAKHLTGHFNRHLLDCLFLFADEVVWGGDKQGEGVLKALVTERTVRIEPKGKDTFPAPNRLKIAMASNAEWCVPVSGEERRYFVCDVSNAKRADRDYFDGLHAAIENGEAEAMLHDLMQMDLSSFSHRDVPHTAGLNLQKMEGLDSVARWWAGCLDQGRLVGGLGGVQTWLTRQDKREVHRAYVEHCHDHGERHAKGEATFSKTWRKIAPSIRDTRAGTGPREWVFQDLETHRAEFLKAMNIDIWDWPENENPVEGEEADNVHDFKARV